MKYGILLALVLSTMLAGATCFPLFELDPSGDVSSERLALGVSVIKPTTDKAVKQGDQVLIEWMAANLADSTGVATVYVRSSADLSETILDGGIRVSESSGKQTLYWDTSENLAAFSGEYTIHAELEAGNETASGEATGKISVHSAPFFEFTLPIGDVTLEKGEPDDPNDPDSPLTAAEITIHWNSFDLESDSTALIGLDSDRSDLSHDSGNEITIYEYDIPTTIGSGDTLAWDGDDTSGERVDAGTYILYAQVTDEVHEDQIVEALDKGGDPIWITVPEVVTAAITEPDEDVSIVYDDNEEVTITYTLDENKDVFVDFRVDPDESHSNGNETTIVSRQLVPRGADPDTFNFTWDGEADGKIVGVEQSGGYFRMLMNIDRGGASTETLASEHFFFVRETADTPVIALIEPNEDVTLTAGAGGDFLIKWRDDDPDESAEIRLVMDDDDTPNQGVGDPNDPETTLDSADFDDISASEDGLSDTHRYYVADDLAPGRYWIFAYIDRDGVAPWDNIAVAAGQLVIEDPDATP